jgi:hypothetical protein
MHLSHSVNLVDSQLQPELGYMHPPLSVDIILSKEPVFLFFPPRELYSVRCKKCKHTRQKKITIFRGKEKNRYFYIHRRLILYQTENHFARTINIYTCKQWNNGRHVR